MKTILRISLLLLALLVGSQDASAKVKVVEKSRKKAPSWVNSSQSGYIITSATGTNLEAIRNECLENVRVYIVRSIAENVNFSSSSSITQETTNNSISEFVDHFSSDYATKTANLPFLTGISMAKIEDFYWEKHRNKKTGEEWYVYTMKYPFTSLEQKKLVHEFEKKDKEMYDQYLSYRNDFGKISTVEDIDRAVNNLNALVDYFFDDVRRTAASTLRNDYRKLYDGISFREIENEPGKYVFDLVLEDRRITTSQRPTLSSEVATQLQMQREDGVMTVTYDYQGAEYDEENAVSARFLFGGKPVTHKFYFIIKKHKVGIYPEKTAYLTAQVKDGNILSDIDFRITLASEYDNITVKNLTMSIPGVADPVFLDNLNTDLSGRNPLLHVTYMIEARANKMLDGRLNMLRGNMEVYIPDTGKTERINFNATFKPNW